jgi:hypothetical protein
MSSDQSQQQSRLRVFGQVVKWALFLSVLVFVGFKARQLWMQNAEAISSCDWLWLFYSGVCYLAGWLPAAWLWWKLLGHGAAGAGWKDVVRAYYCGHPGKYVPGKALALGIRAALLHPFGVRPGTAIVTGILETLLVMGIGLAVGVGLAPVLVDAQVAEQIPAAWRWLSDLSRFGPLAGLLMLAVGTGLSPVVLRRLAARRNRGTTDSSRMEEIATPARWLPLAGLSVLPGWALHGLSLLCVLKALNVQDVTVENWLRATGAVSAATSVSFFVLFAPGGLGVREGILFAILQPVTGGPAAVAGAGLLRLVWLVSEVLLAGILWVVPSRRTRGEASLS